MRTARRQCARRVFCEQGQALIEVALVAPVFLMVLVGAAEFARVEYADIEVANAARAGAEYGAQNVGTAANYSIMESTAVEDAPDLTTLHATANGYCECVGSGTVSCSNPNDVCTTRVLQYVQVQTSATVNPLFHVAGLPTTYTLTSQATMRVEQ